MSHNLGPPTGWQLWKGNGTPWFPNVQENPDLVKYCWWFRNPKANHLGCIPNHGKIMGWTTNLNWWTPDFWTINPITIWPHRICHLIRPEAWYFSLCYREEVPLAPSHNGNEGRLSGGCKLNWAFFKKSGTVEDTPRKEMVRRCISPLFKGHSLILVGVEK